MQAQNTLFYSVTKQRNISNALLVHVSFVSRLTARNAVAFYSVTGCNDEEQQQMQVLQVLQSAKKQHNAKALQQSDE